MKEKRCETCPMRGIDEGCVPGYGADDADIVFIGEGPGEVERELEKPFSGQSGMLLHEVIAQTPTERNAKIEGFETNAWLCFPEGTGREQEVRVVCRERLIETLERIKPRVIVAMGEAAIDSLLGTGTKKDGEKVIPNLWKLRSSSYLHFPHTIVPTFNPASPLRTPSQFRTFVEAIRLALGIVSGNERTKPVERIDRRIAQNLEDIGEFLGELEGEKILTLDLETTSLDPYLDSILSMQLTPPTPIGAPPLTYIIPWRLITTTKEAGYKTRRVGKKDEENRVEEVEKDKKESIGEGIEELEREEVQEFEYQVPSEGFEEVKKFLEEREFIAHNASFEENFLGAQGIKIKIAGDPMLLHYALDERTDRWGGHGLKQLATMYYNAPDWEEKSGIWSYVGKKTGSFAKIPENILHDYCQWDTPYTEKLEADLWEEADNTERKLYKDYLLPLREMLGSCQGRGVYIDLKKLLETREEVQKDVEKLEKLLIEMCGLPGLNPGSTYEVQDIIFRDFNLPRPKDDDGEEMKGSGEPVLLAIMRANQDFLKKVAELEDEEEVGSLTELVERLRLVDEKYAFLLGLLVYRDARKDISTYFDGVSKFISPFDRCVHPFYHLTGTDTGRITGSRPSLLNVKNANRVKRPYAARPGFKLAYADQAQFELRIFSCRAGDEKLAGLIRESDERARNGEKAVDIHSLTAKMVFPYYSQSPKWWRSVAKTIVFGILYGRSAYAIARKHHIEQRDAEQYRNKILDLFPKVRSYEREILDEVRKTQQVENAIGRRKRYPLLPSDQKAMGHVKNSAINMPIQSMASDANLLSGLELWKEREKTGIYPLFFIHDAIVFEIRDEGGKTGEEGIKRRLERIYEAMIGAPRKYLGEQYGNVTYKVEPEVGDNWGNLSEEESFFAQVLAMVEKE